MKRLTIGLTATAIITLGVFAFVACEKEDNKDQTSFEIIKAGQSKKDSIYIVQIEKGAKKNDKKQCVSGDGACWTWFKSKENPNAGFSIWFEFEMTLHPHISFALAQKENPNSNSFPQNVIVDFPDQYNDVSNINELLNLNDMTLTIVEDLMEDDDSPLLELLNTTSPCHIPAGVYPIVRNESCYSVILPVFQN